MTELDRHYSGDKAWKDFLQVAHAEWETCNVQEEHLAALSGDQELASEVNWRLQASAISWLDTPVPALQGTRPKDCITTARGVLALREILLRMP